MCSVACSIQGSDMRHVMHLDKWQPILDLHFRRSFTRRLVFLAKVVDEMNNYQNYICVTPPFAKITAGVPSHRYLHILNILGNNSDVEYLKLS